jgi:hypothetical protein
MGAATLTLDGTSATLQHSCDLVEDTVWGDTFKQRLVSLQDYQASFEALIDYTDNELDEDLDSLMGTTFAFAFRPTSSATATTNPEYQFTGGISSLQKAFQLGQIAKVSGAVMLTSGTLVRDVTP